MTDIRVIDQFGPFCIDSDAGQARAQRGRLVHDWNDLIART
jgi:hypothetical protein